MAIHRRLRAELDAVVGDSHDDRVGLGQVRGEGVEVVQQPRQGEPGVVGEVVRLHLAPGRLGQRVAVLVDERRAAGTVVLAVVGDRVTDGHERQRRCCRARRRGRRRRRDWDGPVAGSSAAAQPPTSAATPTATSHPMRLIAVPLPSGTSLQRLRARSSLPRPAVSNAASGRRSASLLSRVSGCPRLGRKRRVSRRTHGRGGAMNTLQSAVPCPALRDARPRLCPAHHRRDRRFL